mmetsp:Transcript_62230/g.145895  ORF Transcript_62230/g.145895 Transcript_62230/m.145895 type:complete len:1027 (-) Transcript_62230:83-3163(-)
MLRLAAAAIFAAVIQPCDVHAERIYASLDAVEAFPGDCDQELTLTGRYRLSSKTSWHKTCILHAYNAVVEAVEDTAMLSIVGFLEIRGNLTWRGMVPIRGPCMEVNGDTLSLVDANVTFLNCHNIAPHHNEGEAKGGALHARKLEMNRSHLAVKNSSVPTRKTEMRFGLHKRPPWNQGGCIYAHRLKLEQASVVLEDCRADVGGCLRAVDYLVQRQSHLRIRNCVAQFGGALFLGKEAPENVERGNNCEPKSSSKAAAASKAKAPATKGGKGGAEVGAPRSGKGNFAQSRSVLANQDWWLSQGGSIQIESSRASQIGGCAYLKDASLESNGTVVEFNRCTSKCKGGAIAAVTMRQVGGAMAFRGCKGMAGGSIYVDSFTQVSGTMSFYNSNSTKSGGAIYAKTGLVQETGVLRFEACVSLRVGGGIYYSHLAKGNASVNSTGSIQCRDTYALMGGCLGGLGRGAVSLNSLEMYRSASQVLGNGIYAQGSFFAESVVIADPAPRLDAAIVALNKSRVKQLDCGDAHSCHLRATTLTLGPAVCAPGSGFGLIRAGGEDFSGCFECDDGKAQLRKAVGPLCLTCPVEAAVCMPNFTIMEPGVMAKADNFSRVLHCPNAKACPGGQLPANESLPMCAEGYDGDGCANCSASWGRSDSSVLVCVKCAQGWQEEGLQAAYFILSDVFLLAVATSSVLGAAATVQDSSVLLNQFMSFGTVAEAILSAMTQTAAYKQLSGRFRLFLEVSGVLSGIAQGQTSWTFSRECLLGTVGWSQTIWHVHFCSASLQLLLLVILTVRQGFWFAFVVWTNCFAPSIASSFGRYLVSYRLEPEWAGGKAHFEFLPPIAWAYELVLIMLAVCFISSAGGWWAASQSKKSPEPDYVVFLVRNYKPAYRHWEIERLWRKMLLRLVNSALPLAYSPALQMWCVCLILSGALLSYSIQRPYRLELWNQAETLLLSVALVLAFSASAVLANEKHWGSSGTTQILVLVGMSLLAAITSITLTVVVSWQLYKEYKERIKKLIASTSLRDNT